MGAAAERRLAAHRGVPQLALRVSRRGGHLDVACLERAGYILVSACGLFHRTSFSEISDGSTDRFS